ncbi:hypothetical protein BT96DRAFT_1011219 [Gymnopus androsaceus JB14]|uniref:Uncharacterized protein n=1 Tax=Gymnopus androsaceus JB14 TaxID=1447944 RepID=A0A6A4IUG2_9AGAR|nr:hypothetical protein BT96DRAFT_1011219 [Gymnopus androsaceus JB14]
MVFSTSTMIAIKVLALIFLSVYSDAAPADATQLALRFFPTHLSGKEKITLYHGTTDQEKGELEKGPKIMNPNQRGDLSAAGGFYLTDSLRAAGQFACNQKRANAKLIEDKKDAEAFAVIFEYEWDGTNAKVKDYDEWKKEDYDDFVAVCSANSLTAKTTESFNAKSRKESMAHSTPYKEKIKKMGEGYDMFNGPMPVLTDGVHVAPNFYQYAIVTESALAAHLIKVKVHRLPCTAFPPANKKALVLSDTQGPSAKFSKSVKEELHIK